MFDTSAEKLKRMTVEEMAIAVGLLGNLIKDEADRREGQVGNDSKVLDAIGCLLIMIPMFLFDEKVGEDGLEILHTIGHIIHKRTDEGMPIEDIASTYSGVGAALLSGATIVTGSLGSESELDQVVRTLRDALSVMPIDDAPLDPTLAEWLAIMTGRGKVGTD